MYIYNLLTYNRMPLSSIAEFDECIGKDYDGNLLLRYDASRWLNINALTDYIQNQNNTQNLDVQNEINSLKSKYNEEIKRVREENYELQQRIEKLEMLIGDN